MKVLACRSLLASPVRWMLPSSLHRHLNRTLTETQWCCGHRGTRAVLLQALTLAAKAGKVAICRMILDCGPLDPGPLAEACGSALRFAAMNGDEAMLLLLIKELRRRETRAALPEMWALCHAAQQSKIRVRGWPIRSG